jgi:hypothetical protein
MTEINKAKDQTDKNSQSVQGQENTGTSRRRFVKGAALAVPAIMTLRNGQATAMVSSVQCFYNGPASADEALKEGDKIVYVNIDATGQINYVGDNPNMGSPITPSCYSSFMPVVR